MLFYEPRFNSNVRTWSSYTHTIRKKIRQVKLREIYVYLRFSHLHSPQQDRSGMFVYQRTKAMCLTKSCVLISYNDLPEFNRSREALKCDYIIVQTHGIGAGAERRTDTDMLSRAPSTALAKSSAQMKLLRCKVFSNRWLRFKSRVKQQDMLLHHRVHQTAAVCIRARIKFLHFAANSFNFSVIFFHSLWIWFMIVILQLAKPNAMRIAEREIFCLNGALVGGKHLHIKGSRRALSALWIIRRARSKLWN